MAHVHLAGAYHILVGVLASNLSLAEHRRCWPPEERLRGLTPFYSIYTKDSASLLLSLWAATRVLLSLRAHRVGRRERVRASNCYLVAGPILITSPLVPMLRECLIGVLTETHR